MNSSPGLGPQTRSSVNDSICRHVRHSLADADGTFPCRDAGPAVLALAPANEQTSRSWARIDDMQPRPTAVPAHQPSIRWLVLGTLGLVIFHGALPEGSPWTNK